VHPLPSFNKLKAGGSVPVKFSLGSNLGLEIFANGYPTSVGISCPTSAASVLSGKISSANTSKLTYDAKTNQYTYNWKTDKTWASTCRQLILRFLDGL